MTEEQSVDKEIPKKDEKSEQDTNTTKRYTGTCKWFNVNKGYGFIIDDITKEDLFVHQSHLLMKGFRSLDDMERVSYMIRPRDNGKGLEAIEVSAEDANATLRGNKIHPLGRKKAEELRCFRCGKCDNHRAKNCPNVREDGKLCYGCGAPDHLRSQCTKTVKAELKMRKELAKDKVPSVEVKENPSEPIEKSTDTC